MESKFSIIITTYNRPEKVYHLVSDLLLIKSDIEEIIVIDSSNDDNQRLKNLLKNSYLKSNHKNQPYQRFLGYLKSTSEILIYLDDDMEILDASVFSDVQQLFEDSEVVGVGLAFENKHSDTFLNNAPKSSLKSHNRYLNKIRSLTGYAELPIGRFGWNGVRGKQPSVLGATEWFSGGAFAVRRNKFFNNFNFQLFDLFEQRIGMGEDMLISYTLSKQGKVLHFPQVTLLHNDQKNSTYTTDFVSFNRRVAFSRLFLSLEYARLNHFSTYRAYMAYHWYMLWRVTGLVINAIIKFGNKPQTESLKGAIQGWRMSFNFHYEKNLKRNEFWQNQTQIDLNKSINVIK